MRAVLLGVLFGVGLSAACSENAAAAAVRSDDALILELGGGNGSIRESLLAAGVTIAPPQRLRATAVAETAPGGDPGAGVSPPAPVEIGKKDKVDEPVQDHADEPVPPPAPEAPQWKIVKLRHGQNLVDIAKEHLGNGNRFRVLLECNGWTEEQARRLSDGTDVRVPLAPANGKNRSR